MKNVLITIIPMILLGSAWIVSKELKLPWIGEAVMLIMGLMGIFFYKSMAEFEIWKSQFHPPFNKKKLVNKKFVEFLIILGSAIFICTGCYQLIKRFAL